MSPVPDNVDLFGKFIPFFQQLSYPVAIIEDHNTVFRWKPLVDRQFNQFFRDINGQQCRTAFIWEFLGFSNGIFSGMHEWKRPGLTVHAELTGFVNTAWFTIPQIRSVSNDILRAS